jgi:hypothetical protein
MKKLLLMLAAIVSFAIIANTQNIVLRGSQSVCGGGAKLTLGPGSKMIFYNNYQTYNGTYNINNGYINLYENGNKIYSFPYSSNGDKIKWVDVGGTKFTPCN